MEGPNKGNEVTTTSGSFYNFKFIRIVYVLYSNFCKFEEINSKEKNTFSVNKLKPKWKRRNTSLFKKDKPKL